VAWELKAAPVSIGVGKLACRSGTKPEDGIFEQTILDGRGEVLVAVPHIHIEHPVMGIRPNNRNISFADNILLPSG